jgi:hypothetical protein
MVVNLLDILLHQFLLVMVVNQELTLAEVWGGHQYRFFHPTKVNQELTLVEVWGGHQYRFFHPTKVNLFIVR